eukprot:NODE_5_length_72347_cov_1.339331.p58 type:complete len:108 gc:universal NODE_5_length_72347_cov_1.339331:35936-35613(-)
MPPLIFQVQKMKSRKILMIAAWIDMIDLQKRLMRCMSSIKMLGLKVTLNSKRARPGLIMMFLILLLRSKLELITLAPLIVKARKLAKIKKMKLQLIYFLSILFLLMH